MDQEIKAKWLEALRSGKYAQTLRSLRDNRGMCCLGVLCDVVNSEQWKKSTEFYFTYEGEINYPPTSLLLEVGLTIEAAYPLTHLNDDGAPFAKIADHIEANL